MDPQFIRVPMVALMKAMVPKDCEVRAGCLKKSFRENVMMVASGGCRKSTITKLAYKLVRNSVDDPDVAGILEVLIKQGMCRKKKVSAEKRLGVEPPDDGSERHRRRLSQGGSFADAGRSPCSEVSGSQTSVAQSRAGSVYSAASSVSSALLASCVDLRSSALGTNGVGPVEIALPRTEKVGPKSEVQFQEGTSDTSAGFSSTSLQSVGLIPFARVSGARDCGGGLVQTWTDCDSPFWIQFNSRASFEGMIDHANSLYGEEGPRNVLIYDELSMCVDGAGFKIVGVFC